MMKNMVIIKNKISKEEVSGFPKESFDGRIIVIQTENELEKAVDYLLGYSILGIDSETKPSFTKGQSHKVALLQISAGECCFLFRLNKIGFPSSLMALLENSAIIKVGLSLRDDFMALHKRGGFNPRACVEVQELVKDFGIQDKSLQKVYGILFGKKISKSQRLSNWEADVLSDAQKIYAATDAWACYRIYEFLDGLKRTGGYKLEKIVEKVEVNSEV